MCEICVETRAYAATHEIPAKDWLVTELTDYGPGHFYRFHVVGENLNLPEGHRDRRFSWDVPSVDDPRYDLANAARVEPTPKQRAGWKR